MKRIFLILISCCIVILLSSSTSKTPKKTEEKSKLNSRLAKGWNTWNTRSVLSFVLLPEYYSIDLMLQDKKTGAILKEALIGRRGAGEEIVTPGPHSYDGSYTEQTVWWDNIKVKVQSATNGQEFALIITPLNKEENNYLLIKPNILWDGKGKVQINPSNFSFKNKISIKTLYIKTADKIELCDTLMKCSLTGKVFISSNKNKSSGEIEAFITKSEIKQKAEKKKIGADSTLYDAMQTVLAWDVIYEPTHKRVIAPVSRIWNCGWGGWVLFDWDTYFASFMFAIDNKELAYSNAIAITKEITKSGFIPNFGAGLCNSEDRSQPPVGSFVIWKIYQNYPEKWFLEEVFDELLSWNRWWEKNRDVDGYMCWGSDLYNTGDIPKWLSQEVGKKQAAMWESGLDNSPMYDNAVFDSTKHKLLLADVGLLSMYIWDCKNLSLIAKELGRNDIKDELDIRIKKYSKSLETLWDKQTGMYLNKDLTTGEFSQSLSPTNFYPLLTGIPTQDKAERMMNEHFYNPKEFWGDWILPSTTRNNNAFKDNTYWRGRIWAPMNMLVYLGIKNYNLPKARKDLTEKSANLILKSWLEERHIYENYNSVTGAGSDVDNSDKFYHWGALLAYITLLEHQGIKTR